MKKHMVIELAENGFSLIVWEQTIIQDGTKIKTKESRSIYIAENLDKVKRILENVFGNTKRI